MNEPVFLIVLTLTIMALTYLSLMRRRPPSEHH
jgi:hypothetical protein